jgi:hypothetical protein
MAQNNENAFLKGVLDVKLAIHLPPPSIFLKGSNHCTLLFRQDRRICSRQIDTEIRLKDALNDAGIIRPVGGNSSFDEIRNYVLHPVFCALRSVYILKYCTHCTAHIISMSGRQKLSRPFSDLRLLEGFWHHKMCGGGVHYTDTKFRLSRGVGGG